MSFSSISIHTLHTEGDLLEEAKRTGKSLFQSTPSTRRVTVMVLPSTLCSSPFQSTPSTRRVTATFPRFCQTEVISIHTLHTEGDDGAAALQQINDVFQSTPSTRRVTVGDAVKEFNIRAFQSTPSTRRVTTQFRAFSQKVEFQSTPSTRRVTKSH